MSLDHGYKNIIAVSNSAIGMYRKVKESDAKIIIIENERTEGGILEFDQKLLNAICSLAILMG